MKHDYPSKDETFFSYVLFFNKRDFVDKTFDLKVINKFLESYWDFKGGLLKVETKKIFQKITLTPPLGISIVCTFMT